MNYNQELGEYGITGTLARNGIIYEEYNTDWLNLEKKIKNIKQMKNDATISSMLTAIKSPLMGLEFSILPKTKEQELIAKELEKNIILDRDFYSIIFEILSFFDFGFSVFEKVFKFNNNRKILLKDLCFLSQGTIRSWNDLNNPKYPSEVITQWGADKNINVQTKVPFDKLLLFSRNKVGDNYEGESALRPIFGAWRIKNDLMKISAMSAERFGLGIIQLLTESTITDEDKKALEQMLASMSANQRPYFLGDKNKTGGIEILTAGVNNSNIALPLIEYYDRKIYDSNLLGFINLSSGGGGSYALSESQIKFFMQSLKKEVNYILSVLNKLIVQLCNMNDYYTEDGYPEFHTSKLEDTNKTELINNVSTALNSNMLGVWTKKDIEFTRQELGLPDLEDQATITPTTPTTQKYKLSEKKDYQNQVNKAELLIQDFYNFYLEKTKKTEKELKEFLNKKLSNVDTIVKDGKIYTEPTKRNDKIKNDIYTKINKLEKDLKIFSESEEVKSYFREITKLAKENTGVMNLSNYSSFSLGFLSNITACFSNYFRQKKEAIGIFLTTVTAYEATKKDIEDKEINRNILDLSTTTHMRGLYNAEVVNTATEEGFNNFIITAPDQRIADLQPSGMSKDFVYRIMTKPQIEKMSVEKGGSSDPLTSLNLHHGAFLYFVPIASELINEYEKELKEKRKNLLDNLK